MYPSSSSSSSSSSKDAAIEQTQLVIKFKDAVINYSKKEDIDFKPYMLDIPSAPSGSGFGASSAPRLSIYLPDTHNVAYIFDKYFRLYKTAVGNPALVFVEKKMFLEYMQFARELIKKGGDDRLAPKSPVSADDKIKMVNNNIVFIVNTLFQKNRIIVTGNKKDRIQTTVAGKPVVVAQSYYLDTYNLDELSYGPSAGIKKKYEAGDTLVFEKETQAKQLKDEIDANFKPKRVDAEKEWIQKKNDYATAVAAIPAVPPAITAARDAVEKARDEYNQARDAEKEKLAEREKVVSEINQLQYGKENSEVKSILQKIASLESDKTKQENNKKEREREKATNEKKLKDVEARITKLDNDIIDEQKRIITDIFRHTNPLSSMGTAALAAKIETLRATATPAQLELYRVSKDMLDKWKAKKYELEGRDRTGYGFTSSASSGSVPSVKAVIKKLDEDIRKMDDGIREIESNIKRERLKLEDYKLRIYVYELKGAKLVTKYMSNGKKNQQFVLLEKKGYDDSVKGSDAYKKNADKMVKDAPMFSQASCLQKKIDIQNMFDNMILTTKEKIKDALDEQTGGGDGPEEKKEGDTKKEEEKPEEKPEEEKKEESKFKKLLGLLLDPPEPVTDKSGIRFTKSRNEADDVACTATIKKAVKAKVKEDKEEGVEKGKEEKGKEEKGDDDIDEAKAEDMVNRMRRMTKVPLGTYPSFLIPQSYFEMHQVLYRPASASKVDVDCVNPPMNEKKEIVIRNLEQLLYPSKIPVIFPGLAVPDDEKKKYKETIEKPTKFGPMKSLVVEQYEMTEEDYA